MVTPKGGFNQCLPVHWPLANGGLNAEDTVYRLRGRRDPKLGVARKSRINRLAEQQNDPPITILDAEIL